MKKTRLQKHIEIQRYGHDPIKYLDVQVEQIEAELQQEITTKIPETVQKEVAKIVVKDGETPIRGRDYFTEQDIQQIAELVKTQIVIPVPENGKDADEDRIIDKVLNRIVIPTPHDGATPQAGVDYPTEEQIKNLISTEIAYLFSIKPKENKGITKEEVNQLIGKIQQKIDWNAHAKEIVKAIETLRNTPFALDFNALKNVPSFGQKHTLHRGGGSGYFLSVDGVSKGFVQNLNFVSGSNVTITHSVVDGQDTLTFTSTGGGPTVDEYILLETGDFLLQEIGDKIIQE